MVDKKRSSRHDIGNGKDLDDLGEQLESCPLPPECPFEPALERLQAEQHDRIQAESALAATLDAVSEKAKAALMQLEVFERRLRDFSHDFERHLRNHRYLDLAVISIGAAVGGFLAKVVFQ